MAYEAPKLRELGSLHQLTLQQFNKIGAAPDALSQIDPDVIGSFTPL
jgi:hypothetical protein